MREPSLGFRDPSKANRAATTTPTNDPDPSLTESQDGSRSTAVLGTVVGGRYYVRRLCGEGGMGRVYEAEHIDIGKRVALKILHPAYSQTPDLVERLRREARAASKISHPNVVDVTDSGTTPEGAFFFVMEYLEGIELGELIYREKRLDIRRTLIIGTQICPRAAGGARGQRHPPRPQAGERADPPARRAARLRQGARLRHREERQRQRSQGEPGRPATPDPSRA